MRLTTGHAAFFRALSRCCQAGMPLDQCLRQWAQALPRHRRRSYLMAAQLLQCGLTLAHAGIGSGVLQPWEARLLDVGSVHGRLDRVLDDLADYHEQATDWWNRLRLRLLFPAAILLLGYLALPLPGLLAGRVSIHAYLLQILLLVATLVALWSLLETGLRRHWFTGPMLRFATIGKPVLQAQRHRFLHQLASLYNAGVTLPDALAIAVNSCDSALLRSRWSMIATAVRQGSGLSEALHGHDVLDDTGYALIHSGEASGRLGDMLEHETRRLGQHLALWQESLVDWLPRLAYVAVLLILVSR